MYLTVLLVEPPDVFDAATILRFLYTFIGPRFKLVVVSSRKPNLYRLCSYSRVPITIAKALVSLRRSANLDEDRAVVMDYSAPENMITKLGVAPKNVVISWIGVRDSLNAIRVRPPLSSGIVRYDAVSLLYALLRDQAIASLLESCGCVDWGRCDSDVIKSVMYLARKLVESSFNVDGCSAYEVHAVAAVVSKALKRWRLLAELEEGVLIRAISGCEQQVSLNVFDMEGGFAGRMTISVHGKRVEISCTEGLALRCPLCGVCFCLDLATMSATICGQSAEIRGEGVDYSLVRFLGI